MRRGITPIISVFVTLIASVPSAHAALILNEALANEPGSVTTLEWVEILNWPDTGDAISLSGYQYLDGGQLVTLADDIAIPAGGFAILARKPTGSASFEERWGNASGIWGDDQNETYPIIHVSQMSLRNSSDTIRLISPQGDTSTILWRSDAGDGVSIERIRPGRNDSSVNFAPCRDTAGSTPGRHNSVLPTQGDLRLDSLVILTQNPNWGKPIQMRVFVSNTGFGSISGVNLKVFVTSAPTHPEIVHLDLPEIHEESIVTFEALWTIPPPGISYLLARLGGDSDTSNNSASAKLTVRFTMPHIIVSEFLANPTVGGPDEWIEIVNVSGEPISLEGLKIGDSLNIESIPKQIDPITPGEFLILAESESAFRAFYPGITETVIQVPGWRALNNTGDGIRLIGPSGEVIDSLTFRTVHPGNRSRERVELLPAFASPSDWTGSIAPMGATPAAPNSIVRGQPGYLAIDSVWLESATPEWGASVSIHCALTNTSFGPAIGFQLAFYRDLDFASPGSNLLPIDQISLPAVDEAQSVAVEYQWAGAGPGPHRLHIVLTDAGGTHYDSTALIVTVRYSQPLLIISEFMQSPSTPGPGEWIEVYNASEIPLSMLGLKLGDKDGFATLPSSQIVMNPGEFRILAQDADLFRLHYGGFGGDVIVVPGWRSLNDGGDQIRLLGAADEIIDSLTFGARAVQNRSLERRQLLPEFVDSRDWGDCTHPIGATPGAVNSIRRFTNDLSLDSVRFDRNPLAWPELLTGRIWVKNRGFESVVVRRVRVFDVTPPTETAYLGIDRLVEPVATAHIEFSIGPLSPGRHTLQFTLDDDETPGNNHYTAPVIVAHTSPFMIITEYLADPTPAGPGEWVEIYNASEIPITLSGCTIGDSTASAALPVAPSTMLNPGSFVVLGQSRPLFESWYSGFAGTFIEISGWRELNNGGDKIRLRGSLGEFIDSLTYTQTHGSNRSSERLTLTPTLSMSSDWTMSVHPSGATPGGPNSVRADGLGPLRVEFTPNPVFRRLGQSARIEYQLDLGQRLTIKVYDRAGRLVRTIIDDAPSATGFIEWNGTDDNGRDLSPGPYILFARSAPAGNTKKVAVILAP